MLPRLAWSVSVAVEDGDAGPWNIHQPGLVNQCRNASEIIHIGQAIMCQPPPNNTLMYFINTTFNYPTMAEAYRVAALNGLNRIFTDDGVTVKQKPQPLAKAPQ